MEFLSNIWDLIVATWDLLMLFIKNPPALIAAVVVGWFFYKLMKTYKDRFGGFWD